MFGTSGSLFSGGGAGCEAAGEDAAGSAGVGGDGVSIAA